MVKDQGLDDTTLTAEDKYSINFTQSGKGFVFGLHYNGRNSVLFVNATIIYQFKAEDSEIKKYRLCLGNISWDFSVNNIKKTRLNGCLDNFSFEYRDFDTNNINDIHKYLKKNTQYKMMFGLIKKSSLDYTLA